MEIPVQDRSNYLKGLLIVAKKDRQLYPAEKKILKNFAARLGFASDFYEETICNLLANKYIDESEIIFSDKAIAEMFISDGISLAYTDKDIHENEIVWLRRTALLNGFSEEWFNKKLTAYNKSDNPITDFALFSII